MNTRHGEIAAKLLTTVVISEKPKNVTYGSATSCEQ
jgi:hypothetical protein